MENLVSANLSLLTETLVARGACCCWVEMQEICRFKPVGVAFSWVVLLDPGTPPPNHFQNLLSWSGTSAGPVLTLS